MRPPRHAPETTREATTSPTGDDIVGRTRNDAQPVRSIRPSRGFLPCCLTPQCSGPGPLSSTKAAEGCPSWPRRDAGLTERPRGDPGRPRGKVLRLFVPFPVVGFNLEGVTTLEWKRGSRFSRSGPPGELLIAPAEMASPYVLPPNRQGPLFFDPPLPVPRRAESGPDGSTIEIVEAATAVRSSAPWASGWPRGSTARSPARLFASRSSSQSRSSCCRDTRRCRTDPTPEALADPTSAA